MLAKLGQRNIIRWEEIKWIKGKGGALRRERAKNVDRGKNYANSTEIEKGGWYENF